MSVIPLWPPHGPPGVVLKKVRVERGEFCQSSVERLLRLLVALGQDVEIVSNAAGEPERCGRHASGLVCGAMSHPDPAFELPAKPPS